MVTIYQETIQVARINNFQFLILTRTSLILMIFIGPENHQFTTSSSIGLARVLFGRGLNVDCHGWWINLARSILRNPRKFRFSSQTKYSPPLITFVSVVNPYLQNFLDESEKQPSTDSADSWWRANPRNQQKFLHLEDFLFFFIKVLKVLLWYFI